MRAPVSCLLVKTELRRDQWCSPGVCDDQDYSQGRGHYLILYLDFFDEEDDLASDLFLFSNFSIFLMFYL